MTIGILIDIKNFPVYPFSTKHFSQILPCATPICDDLSISSREVCRYPWTHRRIRRMRATSLRSAIVRIFCRGHDIRWQSAPADCWRSRTTDRAMSKGWRIVVYRCTHCEASTKKRSSRPAKPVAPASYKIAAASPVSTCVPRREIPPKLAPQLIASCVALRCVAMRCDAWGVCEMRKQ